MLGSTIVMTLLALVLIYVGYRKGNGAHILGLKTGLLFYKRISDKWKMEFENAYKRSTCRWID